MLRIAFVLMATSLTFAQTLEVERVDRITAPTGESIHHPFFNPKGELYFTSSNYRGVRSIDLQSKVVAVLTDDLGAGYEPAFSEDAARLLHRADEFVDGRKYSSIVSRGVADGEAVVAVKSARDVKSPKAIGEDEGAAIVAGTMTAFSVKDGEPRGVRANHKPVAVIENQALALYRDGAKRALRPLGEGNYIWPSVSPQGDKLLFVKAGVGAFVADLDGNVLAELGYLNAPAWSPNGEWIVGMNDRDDGYQVVSSDVVAVSADGAVRKNLTNTPDVHEMYPAWSPDGTTIAANDPSGELTLITLVR
jgi:Tol biopolymer transport system component